VQNILAVFPLAKIAPAYRGVGNNDNFIPSFINAPAQLI